VVCVFCPFSCFICPSIVHLFVSFFVFPFVFFVRPFVCPFIIPHRRFVLFRRAFVLQFVQFVSNACAFGLLVSSVLFRLFVLCCVVRPLVVRPFISVVRTFDVFCFVAVIVCLFHVVHPFVSFWLSVCFFLVVRLFLLLVQLFVFWLFVLICFSRCVGFVLCHFVLLFNHFVYHARPIGFFDHAFVQSLSVICFLLPMFVFVQWFFFVCQFVC